MEPAEGKSVLKVSRRFMTTQKLVYVHKQACFLNPTFTSQFDTLYRAKENHTPSLLRVTFPSRAYSKVKPRTNVVDTAPEVIGDQVDTCSSF